MIAIILLILTIIYIICQLTKKRSIEPYWDYNSCVLMLRKLKEAVARGELTNRQAEILWISKGFSRDCGSTYDMDCGYKLDTYSKQCSFPTF
jgi:hypothetical protein